MKRIVGLLLVMCVCIMTLCSCNENKEVPAEVAFSLVSECKYYDTKYNMTYDIKHSYNSESNTDTAILYIIAEGQFGSYFSSCNALYQYHADGAWSALSASEWSKPTYTYNNNLVGTWNVKDAITDIGSYTIEITSVGNDSISLNYRISKPVYGGLFNGNVTLETSGTATVDYSSKYLWVPIDLPEGFYARVGQNSLSSTDLCIYLDIAKGVTGAYIDGTLSYVG